AAVPANSLIFSSASSATSLDLAKPSLSLSLDDIGASFFGVGSDQSRTLRGLGRYRPPPYDPAMDFDWPDDLRALQAEADGVAAKAVAMYGVFDDGWINGYSREFSRELGRRGWIGMTWPVADGGHGRSPVERFVVTEALIKAGAPIAGSWF